MNKRFRYYTYIEPFAKSKTIRTYGIHIFTLLALTIFIVFAIKPTVETILVLQKKLQDYQVTLDKITQKSENLSLARKNYQELDPLIHTKIQTAIPTSPQLRSLTQSLEGAARENQASISALQIQPLTIPEKSTSFSAGTLTEIAFTFNLEGSYPTLINTLTSIQSSNRLISINGLILNKNSSAESILMSINGKAYYLK